jgi:hypothetical protein
MSRSRFPFGIFFGWMMASLSFAATPTWRWSNPAPHGAHIYALASSGSTVVQAGEYGQAFASDDLTTWRPLIVGVTNMLRSAVWFGPRLIITGSEGTVVYSDDVNFFHTVDLGTSDWLEGVASSGTRLVVVGDNGAIYTSTEGTTWQRLADAREWLRSVSYGNGKFVAVGDAGFITISDDGVQWNEKNRLVPAGDVAQDINRVTFSNDRFWALGNAGAAFQSFDGGNWTQINLGTTNDLFNAACNGQQAVIVGRSFLSTSPPPYDTWTSQIGDSPAPAAWTYYSALWDGAEFLVGGRSGMFVEGFKPPDITSYVWLSDSDSPRNWMWGLQRVGGIYIAAGERGGIFTSLDGFRFDQESVPNTVTNELFEGVGGSSNMVFAVGTSGAMLCSLGGFTNVVSTNTVGELVTNQVSLLGLVWNEILPRPTTNELQGVGVFGSTFIVTGASGTILASQDGTNWTPRVTGTPFMLSSVATSPTRAVVVGDFGQVFTSEDAIAWIPRGSGVTNWIYQTRFLNGQFVAVGEAGLIMTSPDGLTWTRRSSGTDRWLNGVTFESGNYFIAGSQGVMLQSPDAVDWTMLAVPTGKSLYDVAGEDGRLLTVGIEGASLRTRLLPWQNPVNFLAFNIQTNTQAFLISGEFDQQFTLQRSPDLRRWADIASGEILDNSGSSVFYNAVVSGIQWYFRTALIQP